MRKVLLLATMAVATTTINAQKINLDKVFTDAEKQTQLMLTEIPGATKGNKDLVSPRTLDKGELRLVASRDWTSGFFPGVLWYLYEYSRKPEWKQEAEKFTALIEREKLNGVTHDMGFKIYCSFGTGYQLNQDPHYREVIIQSAKTLATRFNPIIGCLRSWDHSRDKWGFPVIIDNMMNLELLFAATELTGDSSFYKIAVSHANTTMKNHFRADYSSYHVIDYDTITGNVVKKNTHQGYSHESAWSRGQAWAVYGYTMCYRFTHDKKYLDQAEHIAAYILKHPNMPKDLVPYYDFDAPGIPDEPRDASAAAVIASGLFELSTYSKQGKIYKQSAQKIMASLTNHYRAPMGTNKGFVLLHSTGSKPSSSEVDVPLSYADYYYLEALLRDKKLKTKKPLVPHLSAVAQSDPARDQRMKWWREARFGMFIHWGVYAQLAGVYKGHEQLRGGAEWIMNRSKIPVAEYREYARQFNPVKYNPDAWVRMAKDAGMKYIVITAKHHDGFALFKSGASKWDIADATPYGKDLLQPLAAACKKYGVKLGFYYSQAQDWNNPGGSAARKVMAEGWLNPDSTKIDAYTAANGGHWDPAQQTETFAQYIDKVAVPQVKELLTNYGDIAVLWWDTPTNMTDDAALKLQEVLKLQPNIITNDRLKRPNFPGDTKTPEQKIPNLNELDGKDWETCMTMNGTWGFRTADQKWKSTETLIRNLVDIASKGGNYLLNIGPKPDGEFPQESIDRLKEIGQWMKINSEAIYATKASPLPPFNWGRCTIKEKNGNTTLYLSVFDWPQDGLLQVPGLTNKVINAQLLTGGKLKSVLSAEATTIALPEKNPGSIATVIKVEVKGKVENKALTSKGKMKTGELD